MKLDFTSPYVRKFLYYTLPIVKVEFLSCHFAFPLRWPILTFLYCIHPLCSLSMFSICPFYSSLTAFSACSIKLTYICGCFVVEFVVAIIFLAKSLTSKSWLTFGHHSQNHRQNNIYNYPVSHFLVNRHRQKGYPLLSSRDSHHHPRWSPKHWIPIVRTNTTCCCKAGRKVPRQSNTNATSMESIGCVLRMLLPRGVGLGRIRMLLRSGPSCRLRPSQTRPRRNNSPLRTWFAK